MNKGVKTFSDMWLADSLNVDPARLSEVCLERVDSQPPRPSGDIVLYAETQVFLFNY